MVVALVEVAVPLPGTIPSAADRVEFVLIVAVVADGLAPKASAVADLSPWPVACCLFVVLVIYFDEDI